MSDKTRILLIDDHSMFREAVARLLAAQSDFEIAGECSTVEEGAQIVQNAQIDVVLLDINLGSQQGGAFLTMAREQGFAGAILVVTAGISKLEASRLFQRGCRGIVLKHERPEVLIERIRTVVADSRKQDAGSMQAAFKQLETVEGVAASLTARERQVLRGVFRGQTNKEIANELGISEPLVKFVMQQLFTKTGVRTRSHLVRTAIETYWNDLEDDSPGS